MVFIIVLLDDPVVQYTIYMVYIIVLLDDPVVQCTIYMLYIIVPLNDPVVHYTIYMVYIIVPFDDPIVVKIKNFKKFLFENQILKYFIRNCILYFEEGILKFPFLYPSYCIIVSCKQHPKVFQDYDLKFFKHFSLHTFCNFEHIKVQNTFSLNYLYLLMYLFLLSSQGDFEN